MKKAMFGAGCFWGVQAIFDKIEGIISTEVGYAGGHFENPSYEDVCTDRTGHAEVVQIVYDDAKIDYNTLLNVFWENHDPTTLNRQGMDIGTQYRSVIFYYDEEQKKMAIEYKEKLEKSGKYERNIVTEIEIEKPFFKAEEYHQKYLKKKGMDTCSIL